MKMNKKIIMLFFELWKESYKQNCWVEFNPSDYDEHVNCVKCPSVTMGEEYTDFFQILNTFDKWIEDEFISEVEAERVISNMIETFNAVNAPLSPSTEEEYGIRKK